MDNKETNTNKKKKKKDNRYRSVLNLPESSLSVKRVGNPFDYSKNWILVSTLLYSIGILPVFILIIS